MKQRPSRSMSSQARSELKQLLSGVISEGEVDATDPDAGERGLSFMYDRISVLLTPGQAVTYHRCLALLSPAATAKRPDARSQLSTQRLIHRAIVALVTRSDLTSDVARSQAVQTELDRLEADLAGPDIS